MRLETLRVLSVAAKIETHRRAGSDVARKIETKAHESAPYDPPPKGEASKTLRYSGEK